MQITEPQINLIELDVDILPPNLTAKSIFPVTFQMQVVCIILRIVYACGMISENHIIESNRRLTLCLKSFVAVNSFVSRLMKFFLHICLLLWISSINDDIFKNVVPGKLHGIPFSLNEYCPDSHADGYGF